MKNSKCKNIFIVMVILLSFGKVSAQDISVTDFYLAENDLTANDRKNSVEDQNGDKCALIRVQTTQKGFQFDVGSAGITKIEDNHVGEIWLWVPYGIKHISIRHQQLGSLSNYVFPIAIQKARTYIMKIAHEQVFVTNYDDTKKQKLSIKITPSNAILFLNGMNVELNSRGEAIREMAYGKFTYKVEAEGYYPQEGQVIVDGQNHLLVVNDLKPVKGKLSVHVNPYTADVYVDANNIGKSIIEPIELQIGKHEVTVSAKGYKTEVKTVEIKENQTTDISVALGRIANYTFTSNPSGASIYVDRQFIGITPSTKEYTTGTYIVRATKVGYKVFEKSMALNSSNPAVHISLNKIYNYKNEVYVEGNTKVGAFTALGISAGGYYNNINVEMAYLYGIEKSETIYWSGNDTQPTASNYTPATSFSTKIGYGIPILTRFRITPQVGLTFLKLSETMDSMGNVAHADGAYVMGGLVSLRVSAVIVNHIAISLSPDISFALTKSKGYMALSEISPNIKKWGDGFNVKLGISAFF